MNRLEVVGDGDDDFATLTGLERVNRPEAVVEKEMGIEK